jgi:serine/threonine-protein kinase HipA
MTKSRRLMQGDKHKTLAVFVGETLVGRLTWFEGDHHEFEVDDDYDWDEGDPILTLSMKEPGGGMNRLPITSRNRLPPFFSNLLPEGALRDYLAVQAGVKPIREFFLLNALREDLPGAVVLEPMESLGNRTRPEAPERAMPQAHHDEVLLFSLAGVQLKFSAVIEASGGLTIPAHGVGGSAIVKLPSTRFPNVPENEYSMMIMARQLGMNVADVELQDTDSIQGLPENLPEKFGQSLVVQRFDRGLGKRIHMEDFAQIFRMYPQEKYERVSYGGIAQVVYIEGGALQLQEYIRRLTFNLLIGNADMHLKNWSMLYLEPQRPVLSPAYDLVSTIAYLPDERLALSVAREKIMANITEDHFRKMAAKAELPEQLVVRTMKETAEAFRDRWPRFKSELPLHPSVISTIEQHLTRLAI